MHEDVQEVDTEIASPLDNSVEPTIICTESADVQENENNKWWKYSLIGKCEYTTEGEDENETSVRNEEVESGSIREVDLEQNENEKSSTTREVDLEQNSSKDENEGPWVN